MIARFVCWIFGHSWPNEPYKIKNDIGWFKCRRCGEKSKRFRVYGSLTQIF